MGQAGVTRINIERIEPTKPVDGAPAYEIVIGTFDGEIDPKDRSNRIITDISRAQRNAAGKVEYRATFRIARPVDRLKASGVLLYDVPNRGNGSVSADPEGHVRVISGWQGDLDPATFRKMLNEMKINLDTSGLQTITVPVAKGPGGKDITGPILIRFSKRSATDRSVALSRGIGTPVIIPEPVSTDPRLARLWREDRSGKKTPIASDAFAFADCKAKPFPGIPDSKQLCLRDGFDPDAAYTLVYQGKNPLVLGIGFAATRDLVSFLRSGKPDSAGTPNPAGDGVRWTIATGTSQSGNFLKSFVNLGFNADENGARVFDGINANIAARQIPLNIRFGVPGGAAGPYEPGSEGTLWWGSYDDKARRQGRSSLLDRCSRTRTCPKLVETLGSAEFWGLRLSPGFVGTDARMDIALPPDVRRYYFPSTSHGGSNGNGFQPEGEMLFGTCKLRGNPNPSRYQLKVAQRALVDWVRFGKEPPESRYPMLAKDELVLANPAQMGWPAIPDAPSPDGKVNGLLAQDFGHGLHRNDLSGILDRQPPALGRAIPILVPKVNADGNEVAGVRSVHLRVPLGTYTGWNVDGRGIDAGKGCGFEAGFIPFARTQAERLAKGDPRLSLEERYGDHAGFVAHVRKAVSEVQAEGWLLPEDGEKIIRDAEASAILRKKTDGAAK
ncbi:MAG: alpha/beta hydrolase domain-containing protein [Novosphingobium sp.]